MFSSAALAFRADFLVWTFDMAGTGCLSEGDEIGKNPENLLEEMEIFYFSVHVR